MLHVPFDRAFAAQNDQVAIVAPYYRESFQFACASAAMDCNAAPTQYKGRKLAVETDSIPDFYLSGTGGGVLARDVAHFQTGFDAVTALAQGKADGVLASRAQIETVLSAGQAEGITGDRAAHHAPARLCLARVGHRHGGEGEQPQSGRCARRAAGRDGRLGRVEGDLRAPRRDMDPGAGRLNKAAGRDPRSNCSPAPGS
jgi:hypothetical protein